MDNIDITASAKLDAVLRLLSKLGKGGITFDSMFVRKPEEIEDGDELGMVLRRLLKDEYANTYDTKSWENRGAFAEEVLRTYYAITFDGKYHIQKGGYSQKLLDDNGKSTRLDALESYQRVQAGTLNRLTGWIAGGTIALALIELVKMSIEYHWFSCGR